MFAEVITVGDELLIGQVVDTNSAWIGQILNKCGIEVVRIVSVGDAEGEIIEALDEAIKKVDILFITGGLGPTKDDITKNTLCKYFGTELVFNQQVFDNIKTVLGDKTPMNALNRSQAMVPKNCTIINNRVGTASISWFDVDGKVVISMPGVPDEMKTVMSCEIIPRLKVKYHTGYILHHTFVVQNYAESDLAEKLKSWESELPENIKLAYLPKPGIIRLRLTARGNDESTLKLCLDTQETKLRNILRSDILVESDVPPEVLVGNQLVQQAKSVATAESCTGGAIAARLTSIAGSSQYVKGGIVAYSVEVKEKLLGVSSDIINKYGVVSKETVIAMVKGAMHACCADCAVATTGVAGPGGETEQNPVGNIWIAAAVGKRIITKLQTMDRGRTMNIEKAVNNALLMLHQLLTDDK
ncbi:MAG: CinA family nicotinamide mononucleotide deamidase-related protein [Bacteroidales bacterium]|nr:CinA family nicotinamide mononucleotide deamidase-related protein [Bacteroidales bacterium]